MAHILLILLTHPPNRTPPVIELKSITCSTSSAPAPNVHQPQQPPPTSLNAIPTVSAPHTPRANTQSAASYLSPKTSSKVASPKASSEMASPKASSKMASTKASSKMSQSAQAPEADGGPLPVGWTRHWGKSHRQFYYFHALSRTTTWERPGHTAAAPCASAVRAASWSAVNSAPKKDVGSAGAVCVPRGGWFVCACVSMYVYVCVCAYVCVCVCIYIYVYVYMYTIICLYI